MCWLFGLEPNNSLDLSLNVKIESLLYIMADSGTGIVGYLENVHSIIGETR